MILVAPTFSEGSCPYFDYVDHMEDYVARLTEGLPDVPIAVSIPPARAGSVFKWAADESQRFVSLATDAGLDVRTFEVSDPNVVAEGEAIPAGVAAVVGQ